MRQLNDETVFFSVHNEKLNFLFFLQDHMNIEFFEIQIKEKDFLNRPNKKNNRKNKNKYFLVRIKQRPNKKTNKKNNKKFFLGGNITSQLSPSFFILKYI